MDTNQINYLLAKYFEGNTSLEEERILQLFFAEEKDIPSEWLPLQKQFHLFQVGREFPFDSTVLESKISAAIDTAEGQMNQTPRKLNNMLRFLIAASVTLLVGLSGLMYYHAQKKSHPDTYQNPEIAYAETQKALLYVSQKMNRGIAPLSRISKINTGADKLKTLGKMDESLGMLNLVSFINQSSNMKK
jgi:hypothetical protein